MKKLILIFFALATSIMFAQTKSAKTTKAPAVKAPTKCQIYINKTAMSKVTVAQACAWADSLPLLVKADNGKIYKLHSFEIAVIHKDPYLNQGFGIGMDGLPLLARRAINDLKAGDSVYLSKATFIDEKNAEQKLPSVIFSIIEDPATK